MKIYSTGLHFSCIEDTRRIFTELGHQVDFDSYSGHNYLMGWPTRPNWLLQDDHWLTEFEKNHFWDKFYDEQHERLDQYDAFHITYPFFWTWLLKRFNKPIIAHIPIRYEYGLTHKPEEWQHFNEYARQRVDEGKLFLCANSKFDKVYTELFLQRECKHIPSLCEYPGYNYMGTNPNYAFYLRAGWPGITGAIPNIQAREACFSEGYSWAIVGQYQGIVHCPYAVSTMSVFEFYTGSIPVFIPSHELVCQWYAAKVKSPQEPILWHWCNKSLFKEQPNKTPFPMDFKGVPDPNDRDSNESFRHWTQYSDFYDKEFFKEIQLFNSVDHLRGMVTKGSPDYVDPRAVHERMKAENPGRREKIIGLWRETLAKVEAAK